MKISIVIPTRNRCEFLKHCLATCTRAKDQDLEIVVSDNNSSDNTRAVVKANADPRIVYANPGVSVSMRQNFEFALTHSTGDYVIYIGDDDGVIPTSLATLRNLLQRDQPDVALWRHITYIWPHQEPSPMPGRLKFRYRDFKGPMRSLDPNQLFKDFCSARLTNYRDAANIYHGCVSRKLINDIAAKGDGLYFQGQIPDVNTAISNLTAARSIAWLRNPVTIAGAGEKSNGSAMNATKKTNTSAQSAISNDFTCLAEADRITPELDMRIRSVPAYTYANLDRVNKMHLDNKATIAHDAWRNVCIQDLKRCSPEHRCWDILEHFFALLDTNYKNQNLAAQDPQSNSQATGSSVPANRNPAKKGNAPAEQLTNVATVVDWLESVIGTPYQPKHFGTLAYLSQGGQIVNMWLNAQTFKSRGAKR